ncbi:MAG: hypothetical protein C4570_06375 [Ammonifex sp.]|nr:MAG: hypothetical protein C4570_06375 [Ammonifex sp.]
MGDSSGFVSWLVLMSFKVDAVVELLIKNGVIDKSEFKELVLRKIDQGEDDEAKARMKESLDKFLE